MGQTVKPGAITFGPQGQIERDGQEVGRIEHAPRCEPGSLWRVVLQDPRGARGHFGRYDKLADAKEQAIAILTLVSKDVKSFGVVPSNIFDLIGGAES